MSSIKDGGPAFPHQETRTNFDDESGMSLRDYFAAKIAAELTAVLDPADAAKEAYQRADAMLKAREAQR